LYRYNSVARGIAVEDTAQLNAAPPPCAPPISLLWACNPRAGGRDKPCEEQVMDHEVGVLYTLNPVDS
jgi:hypothetical protein